MRGEGLAVEFAEGSARPGRKEEGSLAAGEGREAVIPVGEEGEKGGAGGAFDDGVEAMSLALVGHGDDGGLIFGKSGGEAFAQLGEVDEFAEDFNLVVAAASDLEMAVGEVY